MRQAPPSAAMATAARQTQTARRAARRRGRAPSCCSSRPGWQPPTTGRPSSPRSAAAAPTPRRPPHRRRAVSGAGRASVSVERTRPSGALGSSTSRRAKGAPHALPPSAPSTPTHTPPARRLCTPPNLTLTPSHPPRTTQPTHHTLTPLTQVRLRTSTRDGPRDVPLPRRVVLWRLGHGAAAQGGGAHAYLLPTTT